MARFRYVIICSPSAFGGCNKDNTSVISVTINGRTQHTDVVEAFRLSDNPCVFFNKEGMEVGIPDEPVKVTINVRLGLAPVGNRNFEFYMCSGGHQYVGPTTSGTNNDNGLAVLDDEYAIGEAVKGGCVPFLTSKIPKKETPTATKLQFIFSNNFSGKNASHSPKLTKRIAEKERLLRIVKRILHK